jgi:hypothetical protein
LAVARGRPDADAWEAQETVEWAVDYLRLDPAAHSPAPIPLPDSADVPQAMREQAERSSAYQGQPDFTRQADQRPAYDQAEQDELGWCPECGQDCGHAGHRHAQGDHGTTVCEQCGVTLPPVT